MESTQGGESRCASCNQPFKARSQTPRQAYCASRTCQLERRRRWQRAKRLSDPDYQYNQRDAQSAWSKRNPNYWKEYRRTHPEYQERNRLQQLARSRVKAGTILVKVNSTQSDGLPAGLYRMTPLRGRIAKMNLSGIEITWVSASIGVLRKLCKERI